MAGIQKFSTCDICSASLGKLAMETPLYCINCIEEMQRLNLTPARYKRARKRPG